jgi:hypothetical protein
VRRIFERNLPAEEKDRVLGLLKEYVGVRKRSAELRLD